MTQVEPTTAAVWVSTAARMGKELRRTQDPEAPPLLDDLGEMTWYLDTFFDRREGGITGRSVPRIQYGAHVLRPHFAMVFL
jgi:hypothetical protein